MYNVVVLDDDSAALNISKGVIENFFLEKCVTSSVSVFTSSLNLVAAAKETKFNLAFLDIDVPEMNGIEVAKNLISISPNISIVFLSQREDLVFDCLSLHPFGFIRKSKFLQDFSLVMEQFYNSILVLENSNDKIDFIKKNSISSYKINEIMFIEGSKNYQEINLRNGQKELIRASMNELEDKLVNHGFIRVHKGYLVNHMYIRTITNLEVVLLNGYTIPISKKRREEIIQIYLDISRENNLLMKI